MILDNTSAPPPDGSPGLHLAFRANGKKFLYCYIRKNACSSFKRLIVMRSKHRERLSEFPSRLQFMRQFHAVREIDAAAFDHSILILRDPLERVVSVWKNKFVQRNGHEDIFASYARVTGQDPETATFADFMTRYLGRPFADLDVHLRPQSQDLAPMVYSDALLLKNLHAHMTGLLGAHIADRFFLKPVNSSAGPVDPDPTEAWTRSAAELHAAFRDRGTLPATARFASPPFAAQVAELYADDYRIFRAVAAAAPAPAPSPAAVAAEQDV